MTKGAALGHERELAHEDLLLLDLPGLLVVEAHPDLDGLGIGGVPLPALVHGVLGLLVHGEVQEAQLQVPGVVHDRTHVPEHLLKACLQEVLVGVLLDAQHIGHLQDLVMLLVGLAEGLAVVHVFYHRHIDITRPFLPRWPGKCSEVSGGVSFFRF